MTSDTISPSHDELGVKARLSLMLVAPLSSLAQAGLSPILPKLSEHFAGQPGADTLIRLLVSSVLAAMIFGSLGGGILADRYGQRRVLLWALVGFAVAGTSGYFVDNLPALLAGRILLGVFIAAANVIVAAMIANRLSKQLRDKWLGFFVVAGTGGAIAMLIVVGVLGQQNWRLVFLLHLIALVPLVLITLLIPEHKATVASHAVKDRGTFPLAFVLMGIALAALTTASTIFLPYFMKEIGDTNAQHIASAIIPNAVAAAIVSFAYGWIRERMGTISIFVLSFGLGAAGILTLVVAASFAGTLVAMVIVGASIGLIAPHLTSALADVTPPDRRSSAIGILRASTSAGPFIVQLSLEPISLMYGVHNALLVMAAFALLVAAMTIPGRRWLLPVSP